MPLFFKKNTDKNVQKDLQIRENNAILAKFSKGRLFSILYGKHGRLRGMPVGISFRVKTGELIPLFRKPPPGFSPRPDLYFCGPEKWSADAVFSNSAFDF